MAMQLDPQAGLPRSHRRDPVRPGDRLRVRVNVAPVRTHIPGVHGGVAHGIQEIVIHAADVEQVQAMVEDRLDVLADCERQYERERLAWVREKTGGRALHEDESMWDERTQDIAYAFAGHPNTHFTERTGRSLRPLRPLPSGEGVEVIERLPGEMSREMEMARHIAETVGAGSAASPDVAQLTALVQSLSEELASVKDELARRRGGRPRSKD